MPRSMQMRFSAFNALYNPLRLWTHLRFELFQNLTEVVVDKKLDRVTALSSGDEKMVFGTPLRIPASLAYVFDEMAWASGK